MDLGLLTAFHGGLRWPLPVAITMAYVLASGLGYVLNRTLNFRSHGAVGPQLAVYAAAVTVNFLAIILGITTGLAALGLQYQLARLAASGCESVYMYSAMRWLVFRDAAGPAGPPAGVQPIQCSLTRRMTTRLTRDWPDSMRTRAVDEQVTALTARPHEDDAGDL